MMSALQSIFQCLPSAPDVPDLGQIHAPAGTVVGRGGVDAAPPPLLRQGRVLLQQPVEARHDAAPPTVDRCVCEGQHSLDLQAAVQRRRVRERGVPVEVRPAAPARVAVGDRRLEVEQRRPLRVVEPELARPPQLGEAGEHAVRGAHVPRRLRAGLGLHHVRLEVRLVPQLRRVPRAGARQPRRHLLVPRLAVRRVLAGQLPHLLHDARAGVRVGGAPDDQVALVAEEGLRWGSGRREATGSIKGARSEGAKRV